MDDISSRNKSATVKPLTQAIIDEFYGEGVSFTIKGYALYLDGKLVGVAGVRFVGSGRIVFSEIKEGVNLPKATVWRCTRLIMSMIDKMKIPVEAYADCNKETAPAFLKRLGFRYIGSQALDGSMERYERDKI